MEPGQHGFQLSPKTPVLSLLCLSSQKKNCGKDSPGLCPWTISLGEGCWLQSTCGWLCMFFFSFADKDASWNLCHSRGRKETGRCHSQGFFGQLMHLHFSLAIHGTCPLPFLASLFRQSLAFWVSKDLALTVIFKQWKCTAKHSLNPSCRYTYITHCAKSQEEPGKPKDRPQRKGQFYSLMIGAWAGMIFLEWRFGEKNCMLFKSAYAAVTPLGFIL